MRLTTRGEYATMIVLELARCEGQGAVSAGRLAARTATPVKYLEQILLRLRAAGVVKAEKGVRGGYMLGRPSSELTVAQVIRLMDGPLAPKLCASRTAYMPCPSGRCVSEQACVLRVLWLEVRDAISGVLDNTTFAELAERERRLLSAGVQAALPGG